MVGTSLWISVKYTNNSLLALKGMGKEFISGYVNLTDGEKDPRNLLLSFSITRVILIEFDTSSHIEVSSCRVKRGAF